LFAVLIIKNEHNVNREKVRNVLCIRFLLPCRHLTPFFCDLYCTSVSALRRQKSIDKSPLDYLISFFVALPSFLYPNLMRNEAKKQTRIEERTTTLE
jgi:hypothetical protein